MRSVLTVLCLFGSTAHAVPGQFTHQGRLLDADGAPLEDETTITFRVTNADMAGDTLWEETITVPLTNGFYSAVLGADEAENPLDTDVLSQAPVWLELQLEDEAPMLPRSAIHAVPYASMATVAEELSGGPVNASQIAVGDTPVINESGEWVGPAPTVNWDAIEGMPADFADGVDDYTEPTSDSFADLGTSCLDGDIPVWDGTLEEWSCTFDQDTLADMDCTAGQLVRWNDETVGWICSEDIDTVLGTDEVNAIVADVGYAMMSEVFSSSFLDLVDVPDELLDGDDNTQLTAAEVDDIVADNGYAMATDIFSGSFSALTDVPEGLSDGDTTLTEAEVDDMVSDNGYSLAADTEEQLAEVEEALLARIALLEEQLAEIEDAVAAAAGSGVGTVMYGDYNINNSADLAALQGYEEVSGSLAISGNVPNIESLVSLTLVGRNLTISNGDALTSLRGLDNLTTIGGTLNVGNDVLTSLDGLGSLASVNELSIQNNISLISLAGLDSLTSVGEDAWISYNSAMTSLDGLNSLVSVGGQFQIIENTVLASVAGLENLTTVGDYFSIHNNDSITELTGLEALTTTGTFNIAHNSALVSLEGLSGLTHVNDSLDINSNELLPTLAGLENLTVITGRLLVQRNHTLLSLEGVSGLTSMARLEVQINDNLTSMDGLDSLETLSESLTIFANGSLCRSTALSFLDWTLTLGLEGWNINSNDGSC
jgi:hypothetical protein